MGFLLFSRQHNCFHATRYQSLMSPSSLHCPSVRQPLNILQQVYNSPTTQISPLFFFHENNFLLFIIFMFTPAPNFFLTYVPIKLIHDAPIMFFDPDVLFQSRNNFLLIMGKSLYHDIKACEFNERQRSGSNYKLQFNG